MSNHPNPIMHDLVTALEPQMCHTCQVSGVTGLSLSVLSGGKEAYAKHFGFRDPEAKEAPDGDTTYFIGSVTKGMLTTETLCHTETATIATQHSSGLGDACDWIPQMIVHKLSGRAKSIDFLKFLNLTTVAAKAAPDPAVKMEDELQMRRERGTGHSNLEAYTGRYWNSLRNSRINVSVRNDPLYVNFQGIVNETYELRHYHHNSWTWNV
ncbi:beta-lactamase transpeptidase [Fusarium subglutinans]|uniref:Beta-lactamase transpeptidase n=1 Tax=Gibberella subglutinans TaxID=42677 RepID=A0A8H5L8G4_GIBSU|nr:beta-lactamase transpeptidase [Fusarium subglutinans]KAF5586006.1 beta-lactamase transpeptidase [Fusarium subglutinans]